MFTNIAHQSLFTVVDTSAQQLEIKAIMATCREYLLGVGIEIKRKSTSDPKRNVELATYFASCAMQDTHRALAIRLAMVSSFKLKCYGTSYVFAKRLMELSPTPQIAESVSSFLF